MLKNDYTTIQKVGVVQKYYVFERSLSNTEAKDIVWKFMWFYKVCEYVMRQAV